MSSDTRPPEGGDDQLLRSVITCPDLWPVVADTRQRRVLSLVLDLTGSVVVRDIAVGLAAREADARPSTVPESAVRDVLIDLHHRCLPKLEAEGLIERRPAGIVEAGDRLLEEVEVEVSDRCGPEVPSWDELAALLDNPLRWQAILVSGHRGRPVSLAELASELTDATRSASAPGDDEDRLRLMLHHVHLPRLSDVGLVDYDTAARTVVATDSGKALRHWVEIGAHAQRDVEPGT